MPNKVVEPGPKMCTTCRGSTVIPVFKDGVKVKEVPCPVCRGKGFGGGLMTK